MSYSNPYENLSGEISNPRIVKAGFVEKSFDTGKIRMNYVVGPENGPPLLLTPAQMGTWESYSKVLVPLSKKFHVFAVDIRGHGKSSWTPGDYSWAAIGNDMRAFINNLFVQKPIVSGNSSGGLITLWCAANLPEKVAAIVMEDPPIFSTEMPRFRDDDKFVYNGLKSLVENIGDVESRDLANYFRGMEMPVSETKVKRIPDGFVDWISGRIKAFQKKHPGKPIDLRLPGNLGVLIKSLSMFDPDFARAFVDGRFYEGLDHAKALLAVNCPILLIHADWKRFKKFGLLGAMDDQDAQHVMSLAPQTIYKRISANHVVHFYKPVEYIKAVEEFATTIGAFK